MVQYRPMYCCLFIEANCGDRPIRSKKSFFRRRRREEECLVLQNIMAEQVQFREQFVEQQLEMNKLKKSIEKCRALSKKIDDEVERVVHGIRGIQEHLERIEWLRIADMKRKQ